MNKTIIIGIGNTLRSDDGLGNHAAELLAEMPTFADVEVISVQQLLPEQADLLVAYDLVIFIDASYEDEPGEVKMRQLLPDETLSNGFSHHFSPAHLLLLTRELYSKFPQAYLFSIGAENFELGETLSPPVQQALLQLIEQVIVLYHHHVKKVCFL